jgi:hypothetical protein
VGISYKPAGHADSPKVRWPAAVLWVAGIGLYQGIATLAPQWGATLPTLALTFALAFALQNLRPFTRQSAA